MPSDRLINLITESELNKLRFIKIDAEGMEDLILLDLIEIIKTAPQDLELAVEITPDRIGDNQTQKMLSFMKENGFYAYKIPNSYEPKDYIAGSPDRDIKPLTAIPLEMTDVLFSRNKIISSSL